MIFDTAENCTRHIAAMKAAGVTAVVRYLTTNTKPGKILTKLEADNLRDAGIDIGLVFEVYGGSDNFSHGDINAAHGASHAVFCNRYLRDTLKIGDANPVVYFAIDNDCTTAQLNSHVIPYFAAVKANARGYRLGDYGCGLVCSALLARGTVEKAWLANATGWNGYASFKASSKWSLLQHLPRRIAGLDTDPDDIFPTIMQHPERDPGFWHL
jgi:hypothetical protein